MERVVKVTKQLIRNGKVGVTKLMLQNRLVGSMDLITFICVRQNIINAKQLIDHMQNLCCLSYNTCGRDVINLWYSIVSQ